MTSIGSHSNSDLPTLPRLATEYRGFLQVLSTAPCRVLQKEPSDRYKSASAMLEAIDTVDLSPKRDRTVTLAAPYLSGPDRHQSLGPTRHEGSAKVVGHRARIVMMAIALVIVSAVVAGLVAWRPWVQCGNGSYLSSGASLRTGGSIVSPNDRYELVMQQTGDLTLKLARSGEPLWATGSEGHPGAHATMGRDGNFAIYGATGKASGVPYQTSTSGHAGAGLRLLDDGNLVIRDPRSGRLLWQAGSGPASLGSTLISTQGLHPLQSMRSPNGSFEIDQ